MEEQTANEEFEAKAREHGWVPEEEFIERGGDKTNWVNSETWETRSKTERLQATTLKKQEGMMKEFGAMVDRLNAREKTLEERAKKKAMKEWKAIAKEGFSEGDEKKLDEALDGIEKEQEVEIPYSSDADYAAKEAWVKLHPEYKRTDVATAATAESFRIQKETPGLPINEVFEKVHKEMTRIYPEHFGNKARENPLAVEGAGQRLTPKKEGMGAEFKEAMEKYGHEMATYNFSPYKGKSGDGYDGDKKLAMADYKKSYDMEDAR